jgi:hypothetical protein
MKIHRLTILLTAINAGLLVLAIAHTHSAVGQDVAPVIRGRALEIVDSQGRVRASIKVQPADSSITMPSGRTAPETVMLRLIDANGRPEVKLGASVYGAGLGLVGETDSTQVLLEAEGDGSSLRLQNRDGRQQVLKP